MKNRMIKLIGAFAVANIFALNVQAQNAKEVSVTINKLQKMGYQGDYKSSEDLMKITLEDKLKKAGLSNSKSYKGFRKFEGVTLKEVSPNKVDIYTKVSGNKNNTAVIMLVSTGYDNFISTATDAATANNTITFLNKLNEDAVTMKAAIDLAAQQKAVAIAEAKLKDSEDEKAKLAKKRAKLDKQMTDEGKAGEKASQNVEAEKLRLENLKGQKAAEGGK